MPATETPLRLRVGARSERGRREENQDQMTGFPSAFGAVYLVADGMGGHRGGAEASRRVAEGYRRHLAAMPAAMPLQDALQATTDAVNADLLEQGTHGDQSTRGMGSTVVLVAIRQTADGPEYVVGHVGDSRAYLLMGTEITRLTRDHSMVQRLVDENLVAVEDAQNHPNANVLLRAIGQQPGVVMDISGPHMLHRSARILLCSDGLWGYVPDQEILEEAARSRDPEQFASNLVDLALSHGSDDNITVQIVCLDTSRVTLPKELKPSAEPSLLPLNEPTQEPTPKEATLDIAPNNPVEAIPSPLEPPAHATTPDMRLIHKSVAAKAATGWLHSWHKVVLLVVIVAGLLGSAGYLLLRSRPASAVKIHRAPIVSPVPQQPIQPSISPGATRQPVRR